MLRPFCLGMLALLSLSILTGELLGQDAAAGAIAPSHEFANARPGGYLSLLKLLLTAVVFVVWVRTTDWMNRDSVAIGDKTGMTPEVWNPITVGSFLLGFLIVISLPIFWAGFPVYLISTLTPFLIYFFMRRSKIAENPRILTQLKAKSADGPYVEPLPQDEGANVNFSPAGADEKEQQVNLIRARQGDGFPLLKDLVADSMVKRADTVLLDFSRERVDCRLQIDGAWHPSPPMDRPTGDAILASLKNMAGCNAVERRAKQTGRFGVRTETEKADIELVTQGIPNGERAQVKFRRKHKGVMSLGQLGMFPHMVKQVKQSLNHPGMLIVSAPPSGGLTSTWRGTLETADRLTRDCVAVLPENDTETATLENIVLHFYNEKTAGKKQAVVIKAMLLSQPDFIAVPKVENKDVMDTLINQVANHERSLVLQTNAKSAAQALLRVYSQAGDRSQFITAVKHVMCQRLVRRLCSTCRQEVRVPPKLIHQLGGDPKTQQTLYNQYQLPPPEQRVDKKGKPIEIPPCTTCKGIGYIGQLATFELIEVGEQTRSALRKDPKLATVESAAKADGKKPISSQAYQLVLMGVTSLAEVQRVLKK